MMVKIERVASLYSILKEEGDFCKAAVERVQWWRDSRARTEAGYDRACARIRRYTERRGEIRRLLISFN